MKDVEDIAIVIDKYKSRGLKLFLTSSFQTHSIHLLHILSEIDKDIPVYFLNTGYHFSETMLFKEQITQLLGINVIDLNSNVPKLFQKNNAGNLLFTSNPSYCCYLNKTQPLVPIIAKMDVWISGVRAQQNANRKSMNIEEKMPDGTIRFHPILHWTSKMIWEYRQKYNLPAHPLEEKGYLSVGCEPCTQAVLNSMERGGRWKGMNKTECGLHTDLIKK